MNPTPIFFLIAGEASGDFLGARLMRALRQKLAGNVRFVGIGGPQMIGEGIELLFPHTELMHFGVIEVIRHIPRLLKRIDEAAREVIRVQPDALITIDSPDFCFRVISRVRDLGGRVQERNKSSRIPNPAPRPLFIHYVAPTVWAWRPGRAKKIAKFLDHLLAVLPFEPPYFAREGLPCTFVGHSVVESDAANGSNAMFRAKYKIAPDIPLLTVLPGSRTSEIARLLPIFRETVRMLHTRHPNLQILVPTVPHLKTRIAAEIAEWDIAAHIVEGERDKFDAFAASRAALACSGTVTLELALAKLPHIIAYKINGLTAFLYRRFIRTRYANLINIIQDRVIVPEFLQENCTAEKLAKAMEPLLSDEAARQKQITDLVATARGLGGGDVSPSQRAADVVLEILSKQERSNLLSTAEREERTGFLLRDQTNILLHSSLTNPHRTEGKTPAAFAVLQILPALITGGVERGTVEMVAALVKAGCRAYVASSGGPMAREVEAAGGIHMELPLASKNPFSIYANIARLCRVIRSQNIDILHARSRAPAWSAYFAAKKMRVPFVTTFHSAYGANGKLKRLYNSVMAKGERIIAISNFVAAYAERIYDVPHPIIRIIHRGVDIDSFDPEKIDVGRIDTLRRAWNLAELTPVILMPARLTRWKGQSVLVRALARLGRRDFMCVIVGGGKDGTYGRELAKEIAEAGLDKNIAIFDTCRDMAAAYKIADMVIVPSTRPEGFGRVVIEAQAMGTPVIAANHGGAVETVIQGETGWLTEPGNAEELATTISSVLNLSQTQKEDIRARAIAHIREHFTTVKMTEKTLGVYREILQLPESAP